MPAISQAKQDKIERMIQEGRTQVHIAEKCRVARDSIQKIHANMLDRQREQFKAETRDRRLPCGIRPDLTGFNLCRGQNCYLVHYEHKVCLAYENYLQKYGKN
jgi:hypothetical protein